MSTQKTFKGYALTSSDTPDWSNLSVVSYQSKSFTEEDVEIAITHCGVCGTDVHNLKQTWFPHQVLPLVVGHEIAGTAVRVGSNVKGIKVGDRVGVGAQVWSCGECKHCLNHDEQYCDQLVFTYNAKYKNGEAAQGGYSTGIIANERLVFPLPDGLSNEHACSMLCGGLTVYSPLVRNNVGPGTRVGVVGIGGLGHYAILFAKALGATVYAFSHDKSKEADIKKMGADHYIYTEKGFETAWRRTLDVIICTRDAGQDFPMTEYLSLLDVHGKFVMVGIPDTPLPPIYALTLIGNGISLGGGALGSKKEASEMLKLAAEKGIKPWIEVLPMHEVSKALKGMDNSKVRYRYVLEQDIEA